MLDKKKNVPKSIGLEIYIVNVGDPRKDRAAVDIALRELKKRIKKCGLLNELREREAYMSPSKYKRYKRNESIKRRKREEKKVLKPRNESE